MDRSRRMGSRPDPGLGSGGRRHVDGDARGLRRLRRGRVCRLARRGADHYDGGRRLWPQRHPWLHEWGPGADLRRRRHGRVGWGPMWRRLPLHSGVRWRAVESQPGRRCPRHRWRGRRRRPLRTRWRRWWSRRRRRHDVIPPDLRHSFVPDRFYALMWQPPIRVRRHPVQRRSRLSLQLSLRAESPSRGAGLRLDV